MDAKDTAPAICGYLWHSKLMMISSAVCRRYSQFVRCVVSTLHHLPVRAKTPYSSQLSPSKVWKPPDHPLLRRIQTAAAGSRCPPQAPPEAAFYSRRASLAVSERNLMIQSSTRRRKSTPFFSALKKIRVHIVFCDSILGITTYVRRPAWVSYFPNDKEIRTQRIRELLYI